VTTGDNKSLIDQALDAFVYAPIGLLLEARELIPKMADRGRGQVALARLAGQVAQNRRKAAGPEEQTSESSASVPDHRPVESHSDAAAAKDALPIEGYDDLSAPQIIPMLETLSTSHLETLLSYESAHRSRATIINKVRQLLA